VASVVEGVTNFKGSLRVMVRMGRTLRHVRS
jgi:hypothetical protein